MTNEEIKLAKQRRKNVRIYRIQRTIANDVLFYYNIEFLFLTKVNGIKPSEIVLVNSIYGILLILFSIPALAVINKIGEYKAVTLGDLLIAFSIFIVIFSKNAYLYALYNAIYAFGASLKDASEAPIISVAIPQNANKQELISKIDSQCVGKYYYLSAISALFSGVLYNINPYIPIIISISLMLLASRCVSMFEKIPIIKDETQQNKSEFNLKEIKEVMKFVIKSKRIRALILFGGIFTSLVTTMSTYDSNLLDSLGFNAIAFSCVSAMMNIFSGYSTSRQNKFNAKYKNKSLTIIGLSYTGLIIFAGIITTIFNHGIFISILVVITYAIRNIDIGIFYSLIRRYLLNFTNNNTSGKILSALDLAYGIFVIILCFIGSKILNYFAINYAMIIMGIGSMIIISLILFYMKDKVGIYNANKT